MLQRYLNFVYGLSCNWVGKTGIALATGSFVTFVALEIPRLLGVLTNAYLGLLTYLLLPTLFVLGLLLIPLGWRRYRIASGRSTADLLGERFSPEDVEARPQGARLLVTVTVLSLVNVVFLGAVSLRALRFMDGAEFCGTACHSVMNPEWVTYQKSPHARVACIECHVGEGVDALIDSKLNGAYQLLSITFDLYERPIPTPVHQLRPARETCEKCHWPAKFYGKRLKTLARYGSDRASTPEYTTLSLKVDTGVTPGSGGIHWHVAAANEVRYASVDDQRKRMIWVEVRRPDGTYERFENQSLPGTAARAQDVRSMDCVDCHNRATHIYQNPARAVDEKLASGRLNRSLPYIRRESLRALTRSYVSGEAAQAGIARHLEQFYTDAAPVGMLSRVDAAIEEVQGIYARNVHHGMRITWGSYPSFIGHEGGGGCFRCHNSYLVNGQGSSIGEECTLCHSMLAYESASPFKFLESADASDPERAMGAYLRGEFMKSYD